MKEKGKQDEKENDISVADAIGREEPKHFGNGVVCAIRRRRGVNDLAICRRTGDAHVGDSGGGDRATFNLVMGGNLTMNERSFIVTPPCPRP
jgi:hypothetical protein